MGPSSEPVPHSTGGADFEILQVVVHAGPLAGKGFPLTGTQLTIGRDPDNDITLDDDQVSRHHARLFKEGEQIILEDLGSTNGTLVNGQRISGRHVLQPADIISIGASVFGVRGFTAPRTVGVTQVSPPKLTFIAPPAGTPPKAPEPAAAAHRQPRVAAPPPAAGGINWLVVAFIFAGIVVVLGAAALTAYFLANETGPAVADIPAVVITSPGNGSQVRVNEPVTVQATASDPAGVVRMELWVSGVKVAEAVSPAQQGQPTLLAMFEWVPAAPGSYTLEVRAYNQSGKMNVPTIISVQVLGVTPASVDTPTPTFTPAPPTPTAPTTPMLTTKTDLNVRLGPGLVYDVIGLLPAGTNADIIGRSEDGEWWQIRFAPAADGVGWVSANPEYSTAFNVETMPIIPAPPSPTPTPTNTPTPTATFTVTPTLSPTATPTPTLTPTTTAPAVVIQFDVSPQTIEGGECVNVVWNVSGVKAVYYEDEGVIGTGDRVECPKDTKTYHLRIILQDNSEHLEERTVTVVNPIVSTGAVTVDPNQTIDFDVGGMPGNDFLWKVEGGIRQFTALEGVQLAPMRDISDLKNLTLAECAAATFGVYTFIDGSDVVLDPANQLIPGRSACFRTNEGRLGKMRFPEVSTGPLKVEWLTWK